MAIFYSTLQPNPTEIKDCSFDCHISSTCSPCLGSLIANGHLLMMNAPHGNIVFGLAAAPHSNMLFGLAATPQDIILFSLVAAPHEDILFSLAATPHGDILSALWPHLMAIFYPALQPHLTAISMFSLPWGEDQCFLCLMAVLPPHCNLWFVFLALWGFTPWHVIFIWPLIALYSISIMAAPHGLTYLFGLTAVPIQHSYPHLASLPHLSERYHSIAPHDDIRWYILSCLMAILIFSLPHGGNQIFFHLHGDILFNLAAKPHVNQRLFMRLPYFFRLLAIFGLSYPKQPFARDEHALWHYFIWPCSCTSQGYVIWPCSHASWWINKIWNYVAYWIPA